MLRFQSFPKLARLSVLPALLALPLLASAAPQAPPTSAPVAKSAADATHMVKEENDERLVEIISDRDESVAQFFARQKLVLADKLNTDGHFWSVEQTLDGATRRIFVSYPLSNEHDFALYLYGAYYEIEPPTPTICALFAHEPAPTWANTALILAPGVITEGLASSAKVVGRITIKDRDKWLPSSEKAWKYRGEKTDGAAK